MLQNGSMNLCWNNLNSIIFSKMHAFGNCSIWFSIWVDFSAKSVDIFFSFIIFFTFFMNFVCILNERITQKDGNEVGVSVIKEIMSVLHFCWGKQYVYINNEFALKWVSKKSGPTWQDFLKIHLSDVITRHVRSPGHTCHEG